MTTTVIEGRFGPATGTAGSRGLPSTPHSDEDRQTAYEMWSGEGAQNTGLTVQLLEAHGLAIPYRTLARWVRDDDWPRRAFTDRMNAIPSHITQETALNIAEAANHGSRYLLLVNSGREASPDRWRIKAAEVALDRAGFGPVRSDASPRLVRDEPTEARDLTVMSDAQLAELAAGDLNRS